MGEVQLERVGPIVSITLSNAARRNAISVAMWRALRTYFEDLSCDTSIRCVIVRGAGGHFSGGADIEEFPAERSSLVALRHYHEEIIAPALSALTHCIHPMVAAIEGMCVGGGLEIAGRCDLRISAKSAKLGVPITRLGFPMAPDELAGLLGLVGPAIALELLLEGALLGAEEARLKGLVTRVVADAKLTIEVQATAERIARGAPLAARSNKSLIRRLSAVAQALTPAERAEAFAYADSHDHREGVAAFLEGRAPTFLGR